MKAISISKPGGPEVLIVEERPLPRPGKGEVLIHVEAAGVNRPDCVQRQGGYPPPPGASDIPGLEIAGEIVSVGDGTNASCIGRKVMALIAGGGYAQNCVAPLSNTLPIPEGLTMEQAAAVPETFFTVWHNVFQRGKLVAGETFLVHGGASGIGTTAIQLAKAFGATVIATAGTTEKCDACLKLGADCAINYRAEDFVAASRDFTAHKGVDVILDMVGGPYIERNWEVAAPEGRIVQIAFLLGPTVEVNFATLLMKRLNHTGSGLRSRPVEFKAEIARELERQVWPLIAAGKIRPVMDRIFTLEQAGEAHAYMEADRHIGKIVLKVGRGSIWSSR